MIGSIISHYRITAELGRGGMGVVYRAEDTKLHRTVALKVLPAHALASEDDRSRFYREARSAAALHHSNIATVFEIDEIDSPVGDSQPFIAMEFVDGHTLADRIRRGPLPLDAVVRIGAGVAAGLAVAHSKDIVHRDIKSGNIMLSEGGTAKILDFGLAKTSASTRLTRMGSTVGTAAYMSPEQARGDEVDRRTDIWSLGAVLYEMIAGRVPFPGDYEQAVTYGILNQDPEPLTAIRTGVPVELERIVFKCLQKEPSRRYQNVDDLIVDLESMEPARRTSLTTAMASTPRRSEAVDGGRGRHLGPVVIGILAGVLVTTMLFLWLTGARGERDISGPRAQHLHLLLPEEAPLVFVGEAPLGAGQPALTLSPDGSNLVYVGGSDTSTALYVRPMARDETRRLPGTEGAFGPFFSPDGQWVGFFRESTLLKVRVTGGEPVELQDVADPFGALWGSDNVIYIAGGQGLSLQAVSPEGGLVNRDSPSMGGTFPAALPGRQEILLSIRSEGTMIVSPDGSTLATLPPMTVLVPAERTWMPWPLPNAALFISITTSGRPLLKVKRISCPSTSSVALTAWRIGAEPPSPNRLTPRLIAPPPGLGPREAVVSFSSVTRLPTARATTPPEEATSPELMASAMKPAMPFASTKPRMSTGRLLPLLSVSSMSNSSVVEKPPPLTVKVCPSGMEALLPPTTITTPVSN